MKKLTFALAALVVLLLASCGAEDEPKSTDTAPADTTSVAESTDSRRQSLPAAILHVPRLVVFHEKNSIGLDKRVRFVVSCT